jgi:hypothetical protein
MLRLELPSLPLVETKPKDDLKNILNGNVGAILQLDKEQSGNQQTHDKQ